MRHSHTWILGMLVAAGRICGELFLGWHGDRAP